MRYFCTLMIFVVLLLAACSPLRNPSATPSPATAATPAQPQANFAFSFAFGTCSTDVLDTFEQTYTREIEPGESVSIPITLREAQMASIYRKMVEINFFDYPEVFQIPVKEGETVGMVTPAPSYRFTVRSGELTKTVTWTDEIIDPTSPQADALRELAQVLMQVIESHPDIQRLPPSNIFCL
jgi:hypothetical protein